MGGVEAHQAHFLGSCSWKSRIRLEMFPLSLGKGEEDVVHVHIPAMSISGLKFPLLCCCAFKIPTCTGVPVLALPQTGLWCLILSSRINMEVKVDTFSVESSPWIAAILWMLVISSQDLAGKTRIQGLFFNP